VLAGRRFLWVLRGRFTVDAKADPPQVNLVPQHLERLFSGSSTSESCGLDDDTVRYFLRLVTALRNWIGVMT
jgi:hypothetical protein